MEKSGEQRQKQPLAPAAPLDEPKQAAAPAPAPAPVPAAVAAAEMPAVAAAAPTAAAPVAAAPPAAVEKQARDEAVPCEVAAPQRPDKPAKADTVAKEAEPPKELAKLTAFETEQMERIKAFQRQKQMKSTETNADDQRVKDTTVKPETRKNSKVAAEVPQDSGDMTAVESLEQVTAHIEVQIEELKRLAQRIKDEQHQQEQLMTQIKAKGTPGDQVASLEGQLRQRQQAQHQALKKFGEDIMAKVRRRSLEKTPLGLQADEVCRTVDELSPPPEPPRPHEVPLVKSLFALQGLTTGATQKAAALGPMPDSGNHAFSPVSIFAKLGPPPPPFGSQPAGGAAPADFGSVAKRRPPPATPPDPSTYYQQSGMAGLAGAGALGYPPALSGPAFAKSSSKAAPRGGPGGAFGKAFGLPPVPLPPPGPSGQVGGCGAFQLAGGGLDPPAALHGSGDESSRRRRSNWDVGPGPPLEPPARSRSRSGGRRPRSRSREGYRDDRYRRR